MRFARLHLFSLPLAMAVLQSGPARADTVYLKNGNAIEGQVTDNRATSGEVVIRIGEKTATAPAPFSVPLPPGGSRRDVTSSSRPHPARPRACGTGSCYSVEALDVQPPGSRCGPWRAAPRPPAGMHRLPCAGNFACQGFTT